MGSEIKHERKCFIYNIGLVENGKSVDSAHKKRKCDATSL